MKKGRLQITALTVSGAKISGFTTEDLLEEYQIDEAISWLIEVADEEDVGRLVLYTPREGFDGVLDKIVIPGILLKVCALQFQKWME